MTNGHITGNKTPEGLSNTALHAMRRAGFGEPVDCTRWNYGMMARAKSELVDGGWMTVRTTPKRKRAFLELTDKGKRLLNTVAAYYQELQATQAQLSRERDQEERVRNAAPRLVEALKRIADQTHDEDTRRFANEVLASLEPE